MPTSTMPPVSRHRRRALAELDRLIGRAEAARTRRLADTAGPEPARAGVILGLADERPADLRRSRAALLADGGG